MLMTRVVERLILISKTFLRNIFKILYLNFLYVLTKVLETIFNVLTTHYGTVL